MISLLRVATLFLVASLLGACSAAPRADPAEPGCGGIVIPTEDPSFTPAEVRPGVPDLGPLLAAQEFVVTSLPEARLHRASVLVPSPDDTRPLQDVLSGLEDVDADGEDEGRVWLFFRDRPLEPTETFAEFLKSGGAVLSEQDAAGRGASVVVETVGSRAVLVDVGPHQAALVHQDPYDDGTRPYHLYWSDGVRDLSLIGPEPAEELIAFARSMYC